MSLVESVGKTLTTAMGYEEMEVVDPNAGEGTENANGTADWKNNTSLDRRGMSEESKSFWGQISQMIGSDVTSMLSVPVFLMEPTSVLQKMAEIMEYPDLLTKGAKATEEAERMAWAAAFAVSVYASAERTWKPFNPILGETFQLKLGKDYEDGEYIAEQVSHHPPIGAAHAETPYWSYDIVSCPKTKFLGNTLEVYPVGRTRIKYKTTGEELAMVPPTSKAYNLVLGKIWVDTYGELIIENITNKWKTVIEFVPCGYFGGGRYTVKGNVFDAEGKPALYIDGKWNEGVGYQQCDRETGAPLAGSERTEMWAASKKPEGDAYGMTNFVHTHLNAWPGGGLLKSDSRLRPDRAALELEKRAEAQTFKHKLEEKQRAEKTKRIESGDGWTPRWFQLNNDMELRDFEYSTEDCPPWTFKQFPEKGDLVDVKQDYHESAEGTFSPWQYPDEE